MSSVEDSDRCGVKIINLILYSPGDEYDLMMETLEEYLKAKGIEHYFYSYKEDLAEEFVIEGNHLFLKGTETLLPGVLDKTLEALRVFRDYEYDFIVRTNVSTIVDFDVLSRCLAREWDYAGFLHTSCYAELDPRYLKYDDNHWVSGVCVILSRKAVTMLVEDAEIVRSYGIIDDIAMGVYFHQRASQIVRSCVGWDKFSQNVPCANDTAMIYRNKSDSRLLDICAMNTIVKQLLETRHPPTNIDY